MNDESIQDLSDANFSIKDLVDLGRLKEVFERFSQATGFTIGFLEHPSQEVLIATGWFDICTKFHRAHPGSFENCLKSNRELTGKLKVSGKPVIEQCANGLFDCAIPVIIGGRHLASLATGQLLLDKPDTGRFREQAQMYGYDVDSYLEALSMVPVVSEGDLCKMALYLNELAVFIGDMGLYNLELKRRSLISESEIARRIKVEEELRESQEYTKLLFTGSLAPMIVMDAQTGVYTDCNEAAARIYGYASREDVIGKTPLDVSAPFQYDGSDSAGEALRHISICREKGSHIFEWRHRRQDGQIWDADVHLMLFCHRGRSLIQFTLRDISERKRAEEVIRESEETLRSMINSTNEALLLTDTEGTILVANEVLAQKLGKSLWELTGTSQYDYFPPHVAQYRKEQYDKVVSTRRPVHFEDEREGRSFGIFAYPVFGDDGEVSKIAIFAQDITKRKQEQEEREKLISELRDALSKIKTLSGFLPICSSCKKIRNDKGYWEQIEVYIRENSDAEFSHSICPECAARLYPELFSKK